MGWAGKRGRQNKKSFTLNQTGHSTGRMLAFVDKNRDLFLTRIRFRPTGSGPANLPQSAKLGSMVQSMQWNNEANMLATIRVTISFVGSRCGSVEE
jgi:hypothetical protein